MAQIAWKDRDAAQKFSIVMLNLFGLVVAALVLESGFHRLTSGDTGSQALGGAMIAATALFAVLVVRRWRK